MPSGRGRVGCWNICVSHDAVTMQSQGKQCGSHTCRPVPSDTAEFYNFFSLKIRCFAENPAICGFATEQLRRALEEDNILVSIVPIDLRRMVDCYLMSHILGSNI